jgi:hypothetical protein
LLSNNTEPSLLLPEIVSPIARLVAGFVPAVTTPAEFTVTDVYVPGATPDAGRSDEAISAS